MTSNVPPAIRRPPKPVRESQPSAIIRCLIYHLTGRNGIKENNGHR